MKGLNYSVLSNLSVLFFVANFMLSICGTKYLAGWSFIFIAVSILLVDKFRDANVLIKFILILLLFVPVVFVSGVQVKISAALISIITFAALKKQHDEISRERKLFFMQGLISVQFAVILMGSMLSGADFANRYMIPYAVLYVIFASINIRRMRDKEFAIKRNHSIRYNVSFAALLGILTAVLSISVVRNFFAKIAGRLFMVLGIGLYSLINKVYLFVFYILSKFSHGGEAQSNPSRPAKEITKSVTKGSQYVSMKKYIIIGIIFVSVVFLILLVKFLKSQYKKERRTAEFKEKKEYVRINYASENKERKYSHFKRGSVRDRIRYLYYKLLKECRKQNISLYKCDTTYDINSKARSSFKNENLNNIRDIYLKARYTDLECTKEDYEEIVKAYKNK